MRKAASVNSSGSLSNYIAREQTALADVQGDYSTASNGSLKGIRSLLAQALDGAQARQLLDPLLLNYAKVDGTITETDGPGILRRLYKRFIDNSLSVKARGITYGAVSAGSNLGSGTINRLTVDAYGYNLEACHMETKKALCTQDEVTGAEEHEEVFSLEGATRQPDQLLIAGSNWRSSPSALSSRRSIIGNPSFSQFTGDITAPTDITNWTTVGTIVLDQTNFYRPAGGTSDTTPTALQFSTSGSITQALSVNNVKLADGVPIYAQLAYNRAGGSAIGTLYFTMGTVTVSVVLSAQTGWNILRIPLNKLLYPRNFATESSPVIRVQFVRTSGTLLVDDLCIGPMDAVDGTWIKIVGGATPFVSGNRDSFSWTDALAGTDSIIQQWLWRAYGLMLPYKTDATETWTDPSV